MPPFRARLRQRRRRPAPPGATRRTCTGIADVLHASSPALFPATRELGPEALSDLRPPPDAGVAAGTHLPSNPGPRTARLDSRSDNGEMDTTGLALAPLSGSLREAGELGGAWLGPLLRRSEVRLPEQRRARVENRIAAKGVAEAGSNVYAGYARADVNLTCAGRLDAMRNPLMTVDTGDGSSLVLYEEESGGQLMFQYERPGLDPPDDPVPVRRLGRDGRDDPEPVRGRMNAFPVLVGNLAHVVLAGEVKPGIDRVLLKFSTDDADRQPLYPDWHADGPADLAAA